MMIKSSCSMIRGSKDKPTDSFCPHQRARSGLCHSLPFQPELNGSSLRIEFLFDEDHGQIRPLCPDQRGDRIQN